MSVPVYIGDEVSAAGFRLAGLWTVTPLPDDVLPAIKRACEQAPLVLLSAASAQLIDETELDALLAGTAPPIAIVPDIHGTVPMQDLSLRLKKQLGVLE